MAAEGFVATFGDGVAVSALLVLIAVAARTPKFFSLENQFTFYNQYHHNLINKLIHIVCIWPIFWSAMVFFSATTPWPVILGMKRFLGVNFNWSLVLAEMYSIYYYILDLNGTGMLGSLGVLSCWFTANKFYYSWWEEWIREMIGLPATISAWKFALAIHIVGWLLQFVGHGVFEKRAPALLDNLAQALVMAPYFVLMEVEFIFGFRKPLADRMEKDTKVLLRRYREQSKGKSSKKKRA